MTVYSAEERQIYEALGIAICKLEDAIEYDEALRSPEGGEPSDDALERSEAQIEEAEQAIRNLFAAQQARIAELEQRPTWDEARELCVMAIRRGWKHVTMSDRQARRITEYAIRELQQKREKESDDE